MYAYLGTRWDSEYVYDQMLLLEDLAGIWKDWRHQGSDPHRNSFLFYPLLWNPALNS